MSDEPSRYKMTASTSSISTHAYQEKCQCNDCRDHRRFDLEQARRSCPACHMHQSGPLCARCRDRFAGLLALTPEERQCIQIFEQRSTNYLLARIIRWNEAAEADAQIVVGDTPPPHPAWLDD